MHISCMQRMDWPTTYLLQHVLLKIMLLLISCHYGLRGSELEAASAMTLVFLQEDQTPATYHGIDRSPLQALSAKYDSGQIIKVAIGVLFYKTAFFNITLIG